MVRRSNAVWRHQEPVPLQLAIGLDGRQYVIGDLGERVFGVWVLTDDTEQAAPTAPVVVAVAPR